MGNGIDLMKLWLWMEFRLGVEVAPFAVGVDFCGDWIVDFEGVEGDSTLLACVSVLDAVDFFLSSECSDFSSFRGCCLVSGFDDVVAL